MRVKHSIYKLSLLLASFLIFELVGFYQLAIAQNSPLPEEHAITLETSVTGDFVNNFRGGLKTGMAYLGMEDVVLTLDTRAAGLWKGGRLILHGLNTHGNTPSADLTGDMQVFSNIEAGDHTGFYEIVYQQEIGPFTFLAGQHDLNSEFVVTPTSDLFLNSSFGIFPIVSLNVPTSIFPVATPCLGIRYTPAGLWTFRGAVYNGDPGNIESNRYNLQWNMGKDVGLLYIAETEVDRTHGGIGKGSLKLGGFYHTGQFADQQDTNRFNSGNAGLYMTLHRIIQPASGNYAEGLNGFLQIGVSPSAYNLASYYLAGGIRYHSLIPGRTDDIMGLSIAHMGTGKQWQSLSKFHAKSETSIELTYLFSINENYFIQPDLQYIIHPGALRNNPDAWVAILRFCLSI